MLTDKFLSLIAELSLERVERTHLCANLYEMTVLVQRVTDDIGKSLFNMPT